MWLRSSNILICTHFWSVCEWSLKTEQELDNENVNEFMELKVSRPWAKSNGEFDPGSG